MASFDKLLNKTLLHNHNGREITGGDVGSKVPINSIQFDDTPISVTNAEGLLQWNSADGTLDLGMSGGAITQQIGQEMFMKVRNVSGSTILNGSPVYVSGRTGNRPNIYLARSDAEATSNLVGLTTQDIDSPADGFVTTFGYVRQIKTDYSGVGNWGTTWVEGDKLYISKTVAGQLTNVEPTSPHHSDVVGTVAIVGGAGIGSILVNPQIHKTLEELTDVDGTALTVSGQFPVWNNTTGYFDFNYNITDYLTTSTAATTYLKLDATNDPVTGNLDLSAGLTLSSTAGTSGVGITFGTDVTLYRNAANSLKTDDTLVVSVSSTAQATAFEGVNIASTKTSGANDATTNNGLKLAYSLAGTFDYSGVNSALSASFYHNGSGLIADASGMYFIGGIASTGSMTALDIVRARPFGAGAGTIGTLTCFRAYDMGATGTPTTMYGFKVDTTTGAVGTNKYGFWCGNIQGATNNYAIQTNAGNVVFNEGGDAASDFRVESDTNVNSLNHDATYGVWGFGIAPNSGIHRYSNYQHAPSANATVYGVLNDYYLNPQATATYTAYGSQTSMTSLGAQNIANLYGARFDSKPNVGVTHSLVVGGYFSIAPNVATSVTSVGTNNSVGLFQFAKSGAGTFTYTSIKMVDIAAPLVSAGTLSGTTFYGVYVNSLTTSGATANYAIYTNNGIATFNTLGDADADFNIATDTENNMFRVDAGTDQIFLGGTTNGIRIDKGGEITLIGTATMFEDLNFDPSSSGGPAATLPDYVDINNVVHREFTSANKQLCGDGEELPHKYKLSSTIYPHCHIFLKGGESAGTTGVTFTLYWELRQSTGTTSGSVALSATSAQLGTTAGANKYDLYDATGFAGSTELGGQLTLKLARTAGNAGDVIVTTYGVHYEVDSFGSKTTSTK